MANVLVDKINWVSGTTVRYYFENTPNLTEVLVSDRLIVTSSSNVSNNGTFVITAVNNSSNYVEVTNSLRTDASDDEDPTSPAVVNFDTYEITTIIKSFDIRDGVGKIEVLPYKLTICYYNFKYRYKNFKSYSETFVINSDTQGYYNESQFDNFGDLITSPTRTTYVADNNKGFIKITMSPTSYYKIISRIDIGDIPGVEYKSLTTLKPLINITVGVDKQYQNFNGSDTLDADWFINLSKTNATEGNRFIFHFKNVLDLATFDLRIVENYVSTVSYTLLRQFTKLDYSLINSENGLFLQFIYDGTNWLFTGYLEALVGTRVSENTLIGSDSIDINLI